MSQFKDYLFNQESLALLDSGCQRESEQTTYYSEVAYQSVQASCLAD